MRSTRAYVRWDAQQDRDALTLSRADFLRRYPQRTAHQYYDRRSALRQTVAAHGVAPAAVIPQPANVAGTLPAPPGNPPPTAFPADLDLGAFDEIAELAGLLATEKVEVFRKTIASDEAWAVVWFSDMHIGARGVDYQEMKRRVLLAASHPRALLFFGGDPTDNFITPKLAAAAREALVADPETQWEGYRALITPVKDRILAIGGGNHDYWTRRLGGVNVHKQIVTGLGLPYLYEQGYIELTLGGQIYLVYRKHVPKGGGKAAIASVITAYDNAYYPFHLGVMEHHHSPNYGTFHRHGMQRHALLTGSFKVVDHYAQDRQFYNSQIGTPVTIFEPSGHKIRIFQDLEDGLHALDRSRTR